MLKFICLFILIPLSTFSQENLKAIENLMAEKNKTHDFLFLLAKLSYDYKFNLYDGSDHLNKFIRDYNN